MKKIFFTFILLCSFSVHSANYNSIRSYVQKAPEIRNHNELDSVVEYLARRFRNDDEKALAILTWITLNIDYDEYYYKKVDEDNKSRRDKSRYIPQQGDIIETRLGVCKDIANLYTEMLEMADIEAQTIHGCLSARNNKKECQENPHVWNAVLIDYKWELVDPTYAMGEASAMQGITTNTRYESSVKKRTRSTSDIYEPRNDRTVDMKWFMVNPKVMEKDHHPEDKKWYLNRTSDRRG